ncbi:MAG: Gfo/Idh/MocA family oxidoreductase [Candidatus Nealsonbacteria bacterium]|nr:Gfo/Idh/MocA family oxidoreductase [Candidatus Nealsonbacteria bacterium]
MANRHRPFSRRKFLKGTLATVAASSLPSLVPGSALGADGAVAPSERIVMGGIGVGNRGRYVLSEFLKFPAAQFVATADCQASRREAVKSMVDGHYGTSDCVTYRDMFDVLGRNDIDAVLIATGDRWHTMASITAARAGKDIYCEKPCSMTIQESRALADVINLYGRIYQAGTQRRSIGNFMLAIEMAQTGKLGKLLEVHANTRPPAVSQEWLPAEPEPAADVCDWTRWLGPCPWRPYNSRYVAGRWRGHFDFHGGGILEWGAHTVDLCQIGASADETAPVEYVPTEDGAVCTYANGVKLVMRTGGWLGLGTCSIRYVGEDGWVETGDSGAMRIEPESLAADKKVFTMRGTSAYTHVANFLDCVKSRRLTRANASVAGQSHIVCHAAYIAWQLGRTLKFDPAEEEFIDDAEANRMRSRAMQAPWTV